MPGSRRAKACTGCRQVKLACDAQVRTPCTRCRDRNLECRFDSNFKRISTRGIVRDVTEEFNNLRASTIQLSPPSRGSVSSHHDHLPQRGDAIHKLESHSPFPQPSSDETSAELPWLQAQSSTDQTTFVSGHVIISWDHAMELFAHFGEFYRPHALFLEPVVSLAGLLDRSPLLFWTICLVSCQNHPLHAHLYDQIFAIQYELLSNTMHWAVQAIEIVHSLLVLCLWPVPNVAGLSDPSWNYVGLAIHAAMQLSCHRPLPKDSPVAEWKSIANPGAKGGSRTTQSMTWLSCLDVSTELSTFFGFPPAFVTTKQFDSIDKAKEHAAGRLTPVFAAKLDIRQIVCMFQQQFDSGEDPNSYFPRAIMFERSLEQVKTTYLQHWNSDLQINHDGAKLYLYAFTFMCASPSTAPSPALRTSAQHYLILQKAWEAASRLIQNMSDLSHSASSTVSHPAGFLGYYPKHYFTKLFFASVFLFRILVSSHGQAVLSHDRTAMISSLQSAHKVFQSFSSHRDHTRAAINIELLVKILRDRPTNSNSHLHAQTSPLSRRPDTLVIDNRLSASIMWDAIFRGGEERNRQLANGNPSSVAEWKTMTEQYQERLPHVPARPEGPVSASFHTGSVGEGSGRGSVGGGSQHGGGIGLSPNRVPSRTGSIHHSASLNDLRSQPGSIQQFEHLNHRTNTKDQRGQPGVRPGGLVEEVPEWWMSWDAYMEDFGVGLENFPADGTSSSFQGLAGMGAMNSF